MNSAFIIKCCVHFYCNNFSSWNHAVAYSNIRKVESVLKNLYFGVHCIPIRFFDTALYEIIRIYFRENFFLGFLIDFCPRKIKETSRKEGCKTVDRQNKITDKCWHCNIYAGNR